MRPRLRDLVIAVVGAFAVLSVAGLLLCWLYAPTVSLARHVAFEGTMLAVTGETAAAVAVR